MFGPRIHSIHLENEEVFTKGLHVYHDKANTNIIIESIVIRALGNSPNEQEPWASIYTHDATTIDEKFNPNGSRLILKINLRYVTKIFYE